MQRGVAYTLGRPSSGGTVSALVLTNDRWNEVMRGVGVVPLKEPFAPDSPLTPMVGRLQADVGRLVNVSQEYLAEAACVPDPAELRAVEEGLVDVLDLRRLTGPNPRAPTPVPGKLDYPRWAEIYWVQGQSTGDENKRYVVVSNDVLNQRTRVPIVVRTTTRPKKPFEEFPEVLDGAAQAFCGEATAVASSAVDQRNRPAPSRLPLGDMGAVAHGLAHTFELELENAM